MPDFWVLLFRGEIFKFRVGARSHPRHWIRVPKNGFAEGDWEMSFSICLPGCRLVPAWDLDVGFLVWRSLMTLYIGGWCWRYSGGQGDLRAGRSGSALPMQIAHNPHAIMLSLFSLCSLCLLLGCHLFRSDLEFVDYFLWIALRKTLFESKVNSINPSPVMYLQQKKKLSSETTQISSFVTMVIFGFQVTLLIQL